MFDDNFFSLINSPMLIDKSKASEFINQYHRHHKPTVGCKFAVGCYVEDRMVGVAVCGRPVSRHLDDGLTCEINRLCTDGTRNASVMQVLVSLPYTSS